MLSNKCVVLGVTGSIAAYKAAALVSKLKKCGCDVHVIMTESAHEFIAPKTFETLTCNKCLTNAFDSDFRYKVDHIELAKAADLIIIAPASANTIAKLANGIADNMLTTVTLASKAIKLVSPAMNTGMYTNPVTQDNLERLKKYGFNIIEPVSGLLACGDEGMGKEPEPEVLLEHILFHLACAKDMSGKKVVVTAGPTKESLDPIRYITNHSTGKMGYALARAAAFRGANVTLISGDTPLDPPMFCDIVNVVSVEDMAGAVLAASGDADFIFKAAAVSDFTPIQTAENKIKKGDTETMTIELKRTTDILSELGKAKKPGQFICGFSMETKDLIENSAAKLEKKNADMIVANNLRDEGAGFGTDTNIISIITRDGVDTLPIMNKFDAANAVIDRALDLAGKAKSGA